MARPVYSVQLGTGFLAPGDVTLIPLDEPYTWVVREVLFQIINNTPDTGGGFATVNQGSLDIARVTFPGSFIETVRFDLRTVLPGPSELAVTCGGGGSLNVGYSISGYQLYP